MTLGYKHPMGLEVYLDGADEVSCRKKLEELCVKRELPADNWIEVEEEVETPAG